MITLLKYFDVLKSAGVIFDRGLSQEEFQAIGQRYNFIFPPDLREFLFHAMPISNSWINWRGNENEILDSILRMNIITTLREKVIS